MKSIKNMAFGLRKAKDVIKSSLARGARLWVVALLAITSINAWGGSVTLTYDHDDSYNSMWSGSFSDQNSYWQISGAATFTIPISVQPTSDITITVKMGYYSSGNEGLEKVSAKGTESSSTWVLAETTPASHEGSGSSNDVTRTFTVEKAATPSTLSSLAITFDRKTGKYLRVVKVAISYSTNETNSIIVKQNNVAIDALDFGTVSTDNGYTTINVSGTCIDDPYSNGYYYSASISGDDEDNFNVSNYGLIYSTSGNLTISYEDLSEAGEYTTTLTIGSWKGNDCYTTGDRWFSVDIPITITYDPPCSSPSAAYGTDAVSLNWVDGPNPYTNSTLSRSGSGALSYRLTDVDPSGCATINTTTGAVTFSAYGTVEVTADVAADAVGGYCAGSASYIVEMSCKTRTLNFAAGANEINYGTAYTRTATASAGSGEITYSIDDSANDNVTVNASTGELTITGEDVVDVKAEITEADGYCSASTTYTLSINAVVPTVSAFAEEHTNNSITLTGAKVTSKGGADAITEYGYIYSTTKSSAAELKKGETGVTTAQVDAADIAVGTSFASKSLTGLGSSTTYYVRAYATNSAGTGYSDIQTIRTVSYVDYQFSCAELTLTPHLTTANTPIFITSTSGKTVRSKDYITITGDGLSGGQLLTFPNLPSYFEIKTSSYGAISTNADGTISVDAYIFYTPGSEEEDLVDGMNKITGITVAVGGTKPQKATLTQDIIGRHLPSQFVIAAKWGKAWYALPANMTETATEGSNPTPVLIAVDDADAPTMAYCDNTNAYNLVPIGGTGTNRFKTDGDKVYLGMVNNSNYALFASGHSSSGSENTNIGKSNGQTTSVDGLGPNFQWNLVQTATSVSSTGDVVYNLAIANGNTNSPLKISRGQGKWGLYSSGISAIRLLPFTAIADLALTVEEWGTNEIAVKFENEGTITKVMIDDDVISPTPSMSLIGTEGSDIKRITGLTGLSNNPMAQFVIQMNVGGSVQQKIMQIPFIVTSTDATTIALRDMTGESSQSAMNEVIKTIDVVVRNGGKLTVNTAEGKADACTFNNLYIYPGGKVDVSGNNLGVKNVYLRGGFSWLNSTYALPQMNVADDKSITGVGSSGNGIYYDLYLDNTMYYVMALPKTVALSDVTNEEGAKSFKAWIKVYNGENRTTTPKTNCWEAKKSGSIERGVGYEVAIKPRVTGRPYGILRFPLLSATSWTNETSCSPSIVAWGAEDEKVTANNKGWNFLGNPFFTAYNNTTEDDSKIEQRGFTQHIENGHWTGAYDFTSTTTRYFTIPNYTDEDYQDVRANPYQLDAFYPFFVQSKVGTKASPGTLEFGTSGKSLKLPSIKRAQMAEREVIVDFQLKDANGKTDKAGLTISNDFSADFDMDDQSKTIENGTKFMKVYTMVGAYRTAFNALPEAAAAQPIPVGYIAPTAGEYTFSLLENADYSDLEHLWLTDGANTPIDLLTQNYSFTTAAGEVNDRFTLNAILKAEETATEIANVSEGSVMNMSVYGGEKHLVVRGLPVGASVWVYDAAGKLVATWKNVSEASVQTDVPASGVYNVRAVYGNDAVTKGAVVR